MKEDDGLGPPNCERCLMPLEPRGRAWWCPECGLSVVPR